MGGVAIELNRAKAKDRMNWGVFYFYLSFCFLNKSTKNGQRVSHKKLDV